MTLLKEPRSQRPITRSYEPSLEKQNTRLYDFQPEGKALGMALNAQVSARTGASGMGASPFDGTFQSEFDEDTLSNFGEDILIISGPVATKPSRREQLFKRRNKPSPHRRRRFVRLAAGIHSPNRMSGARKTRVPPKAPAIIQIYKGVVETVHEGFAYLILETRDGQRVEIEWDETELANKNIGERQPFILKTMTAGNKLEYEFILDQLHPLSEDLQDAIDDLKRHYRSTGELDDVGE